MTHSDPVFQSGGKVTEQYVYMNQSSITIRRAVVKDAPDIARFQQLMAHETEGLNLDNNVLGKGVMAVFEDPHKGIYYVAEHDGKTVASLLITFEWSDWRNGMVWWFQSVYVIPEYRRKGIFRMMYEFTKNEGLREGIAGLRLYVDSSNTRAQKTYKAMGMNGDHYMTFEWMVCGG